MKKCAALTLFAINISLLACFFGYNNVSATVSDWDAGNIITDGVFQNNLSMSAVDIQNFLNSKVSSCDTYGQKTSEYGGADLNGDGWVQRWEWGSTTLGQTVFPCLRDLRLSDGRTASQLIYDIAQTYQINPQVLIVVLQKEQGLITDTWPSNIQYRSATGYGCPDTAPCDSKYYWLENQLNWTARMFRSILNNSPTWYTPYILGNNYIQYNPNASCGGSTVNIQNRSTQSLYNYTPYQPNDDTLNAGWGSAYCGAYGNLRFYQYFTNWFGSTRGGDLTSYDLQISSPITLNPSNPRAGEEITVSFDIKNTSEYTIESSTDVLQCRNNTVVNCDSSYGEAFEIESGATRSISYKVTIPNAGTAILRPFFKSKQNNFYYLYDQTGGYGNNITLFVPNIYASSQPIISPKAPNIGEKITYSYTLENKSSGPISIDGSILQCYYETLTKCDSEMSGAETIAAGGSKTYNFSINATKSGNYTLLPYYKYRGVWYKYKNLNSPTPIYVTGLAIDSIILDTPSPVPNQPLTLTYTVSNNGSSSTTVDYYVTQCRLNVSTLCDAPQGEAYTLNPGESKIITDQMSTSATGNYRYVAYYNINKEWHTYFGNYSNTLTISPYTADMRIIGDISVGNPIPGDALIATYTVKNFGSKTAYYQTGLTQCRYNTSINCDSADYGIISINPGDTRVISDTLVSRLKSGVYRIVPYFRQNNTWYQYKTADGAGTYPVINKTILTYTPNLSIQGTVSVNPTTPQKGQTVTVQYSVKNNESRSVSLDTWITQCRINVQYVCDPKLGLPQTLAPGEVKVFSENFVMASTGTYRFVPYFKYDNRWIQYNLESGPPAIISIAIN